ncbi:MAG: hypothetical protein K0S53_88 [Bacteroidetes bacterium]|jgi:hypothetical protein|nr:hypothetical protein [Bacteroidota bacterium]MDF2453321.1 hypothetical protein [Bacteroidota bacterium]
MKNTLRLLFLFFILFNIEAGSAQTKTTIKNSYSIQPDVTLSASEADFYAKSIEAVDLEKYRLKTKDVTLEFRNGFKLILSSADRLFLQGIQINTTEYTDDLASDYMYPLFRVDESGIVVTMYKTKLSKSESKSATK